MGQLEGKIAIVTGAARGMGRGFALGFAAEGAAVACADRNEAGAQAVADEIRAAGGRAVGIGVDVTDFAQVQVMAKRAVDEFGTIDVLVNNAGIDTIATVVEMPVEQWQQMIDTNLTSLFYCCKAVLPTMIAQRSGRIINIGSQLGLEGTDRMVHYCAAKAGVHGFTRALACEVAPHNINVNAIAPGPIETELLRSIPEDWLEAKKAEIPLKRFGRVEEIVPTAVLLAGPGGSYYTGATLNCSGGDALV